MLFTSIYADNFALITGIKYILKNKAIIVIILTVKNISQFYCFVCILDQINAGLVSRREFLKKYIQNQNLLTGIVATVTT